jgi:hypothetical protein
VPMDQLPRRPAPSRSRGLSSMTVPRRWPSLGARAPIGGLAGACVWWHATRSRRSTTSSSGSLRPNHRLAAARTRRPVQTWCSSETPRPFNAPVSPTLEKVS